ncbi:MAG: DEAD/DEAH box helicase, partial [Acidobacteria bacterium]
DRIARHSTMDAYEGERQAGAFAATAAILYLIEPGWVDRRGGLVIEIARRDRTKSGAWGRPKPLRLVRSGIEQLPDEADRLILATLAGAASAFSGEYLDDYRQLHHRLTLPPDLSATLVQAMSETGRLVLRTRAGLQPLEWDTGEPWRFHLTVTAREDSRQPDYRVEGWLLRGSERVPLGAPALVAAGLVVMHGAAAALDDGGAWSWVAELREHGAISVPGAQADRLLQSLFNLPELPRVELPESLGVEEVGQRPIPCLQLTSGREHRSRVSGFLSFDYRGLRVPADSPAAAVFDERHRRLMRRDTEAEHELLARLQQLGFRRRWRFATDTSWHEIDAARVPRAVRDLVSEGWQVEAEGRLYRPSGRSRLSVRSGIDWFDLHGDVEFGDQSASLPELLKALARGESIVRLGDGSFGVLPEDWLRQVAGIAGFAELADGGVRFRPTQLGLLDALLAAHPAPDVDAGFARAREALQRFNRIEPADPPGTFAGALRGYQREGLGWLEFLRAFGFGGCLADDMGLGKTVMVLALLESHRGTTDGPSLVVAPRSVVFNWVREAERFTPGMRVAEYTGAGREAVLDRLGEVDLLVTSYGTLRRDAARLREVGFAWVVLDEAQAIKNAATASAKAARLLQSRHRLALSGTPVENHLGELWSLFEFLNPGMLGSRGLLPRPGKGGSGGDLQILSRALRPFVLRRTKQQVASDLPERQEETLWCELDARERRLYDELRAHYRATLLGRIERGGLGRNKLRVLEALLRLRQAACHPGLLDPARTGETSTKLETLLPKLEEVREEGHKAIVFSQFTSLLAIVRRHLDAAGVSYEYLDGRTRDREARVRRFQEDDQCRLFLISLKAGGLGLNLTAAEYVFLLDPWWNPAAEAQAIDRAHRIGQTRPVFAYRLIARDTVEERILELQRQKRDLAEALITADESIIAGLTREELELLLR